MRFEKWQALGNDYLIVERGGAARSAHARDASGGCATRTSARAPTACSSSRRPTSPASSRGCGSSTPTARRPSCPATARARRSCTCAAPAGPTADTFSIQTAAGEIRPDDHRADHLPRRHGPRLAALQGLPGRPARRPRRGRAGGRAALPARLDRQPAVRDPRRRPRRARARSTSRRSGPEIEHAPLFPNRTNTSFWTEVAPGHDPRADLRARRGGDAVVRHGRLRRRRRPRAARRRLAGDRRARRRRADRRRRRGPARRPHRLGGAGLRGRAERRAARRPRPRGSR